MTFRVRRRPFLRFHAGAGPGQRLAGVGPTFLLVVHPPGGTPGAGGRPRPGRRLAIEPCPGTGGERDQPQHSRVYFRPGPAGGDGLRARLHHLVVAIGAERGREPHRHDERAGGSDHLRPDQRDAEPGHGERLQRDHDHTAVCHRGRPAHREGLHDLVPLRGAELQEREPARPDADVRGQLLLPRLRSR